jgi:peptidoglycan hydrolase-like protein with peptidoglycan-binding domain
MRRKTWALAAAAVLIVATATGGMVVMSSAQQSTPVARDTPANTAKVEQGPLSAMVSQDGTLTYRARSDGSPYAVINRARGVYTKLPVNGDKVGCGGVLYRVDDEPVVLLCGTVPAYRDLRTGDAGRDVHQLNRNLHRLGYDRDARVRIDPGDTAFSFKTAKALAVLQRAKGVPGTGALEIDDAVFLPESVRIARVTGVLGGSARPGGPVLDATSGKLHVQVALDPSQQGQVQQGDRAQITLPGNRPVPGSVEGFGSVAQASAGKDSKPADATIPAYLSLDDPAKARGLDRAPVQVDITTKGVENALSVPVTALVGKSGGGFAVEVVGTGGRRKLVTVALGLFDTAGGRVQVEGNVREGDHVVVPSL